MNLDEVKRQAKLELEQEQFREAVERYKEKLKNKKSLWDKVFPWKVLIIRKGDKNV